MSARTPRRVLYDCLCSAEADAFKVGDRVECFRCNIWVTVIQVSQPWWTYRAECTEPNCHYAKETGRSAGLASIYTSKHKSNTGHIMRLIKVGENGETLS